MISNNKPLLSSKMSSPLLLWENTFIAKSIQRACFPQFNSKCKLLLCTELYDCLSGTLRPLCFDRNFHFLNSPIIIVIFSLGKVLFFYDGSEQCFSKGHLALFIPSVLILAIFLIPAPVFIVLISFGYIRVSPHVSDIISQGYRYVVSVQA